VRSPLRARSVGGEGRAGSPYHCVDHVHATERRTVLVVEDNDLTRAFLLDNLAADGFQVAGGSGAAEGLGAIQVGHPALVVPDLMLEDGSGLALLDRVRAADGLASRIDPDLPVIVLTGRTGSSDRVRSFARGADDHVSKPTGHLFSAL
jgi:DNA-binding response OmpR family regulator